MSKLVGAYVGLTITGVSMACNALVFVGHVAQVPDHPVAQVLWLTINWVGLVMGLWSWTVLRQSLWYRQAVQRGAPRVWVERDGWGMEELIVVPYGIDDEGAPAWRVIDGGLSSGDRLIVHGLTRHAVVYITADEGTAMLRFSIAAGKKVESNE